MNKDPIMQCGECGKWSRELDLARARLVCRDCGRYLLPEREEKSDVLRRLMERPAIAQKGRQNRFPVFGAIALQFPRETNPRERP